MKELGSCPKCGSPDGLFICSLGAVNCSDCMEFIRKATKEEIYQEVKLGLKCLSPKKYGVTP